LLTEESNKLKLAGVPKNYFITNKANNNYIKKSFIIHQDKLFLINNFDYEERFLINRYTTIELPNFFTFSTTSKFKNSLLTNSLRLAGSYLIEMCIFKNFLLILSYNTNCDIEVIYIHIHKIF